MKTSPGSKLATIDTSVLFKRSVWDDTDTLAALLDLDGRILDLNPSMAASLGKSVEAVVGTLAYQHFPSGDYTKLKELFEQVTASGKALRFESGWSGALRESVLRPCFSDAHVVIGVTMLTSQEVLSSERKQVEHLLRSHEARQKLAMEAAQAGSWEWELATNRNEWSDELWELYGLVPHSCEPSYEAWRHSIHPEDRAKTEKALQEIVRTEGELNLEWRVNATTNERWLMSRGRPLRDSASRVTHYIGVVMDITKRKEAERVLVRDKEELERLVAERTATLKESENQFLSMFRASPIPAGMSRLDTGRYVKVNDAFLTLYGFTRDEVIGHSSAELGLWPDRKQRQVLLERLEKEGVVRGYEAKYRTKTGTIGDSLISAAFIDIDGERHVFGMILDCTERTRAENALRENEARLVNVIQGTQAATWDWEVQTGKATFNERWAEILGYTLDELAPVSIQTWLDLAHPEDLKKSGEHLDKVFADPELYYDCECRMKHRNGGWVWVHDRGKVVEWSPDGKPVRMVGTHTDITERKRLESQFRESEQRLRGIYETSADPIGMFDVQGNIVLMNPAAVVTFGYGAAQEMIGKNALDFVLPEDRERMAEVVRRVLETGLQRNVEFPLLKKDGTVFLTEFSSAALYSADGSPNGIVSVTRDITNRKKMELELRLKEQRLREVLENSQDASYKRDLVANAYDYLSPIIERITGRSPQEMLSLSLADVAALFHPDDMDKVQKELARALAGPEKQTHQIEYRFKHKEGHYIWIQDRFSVLCDASGKPRALVGSVGDITERKLANVALQESDRVQRTILGSMVEGVVLLGVDGAILSSNPSADRILGLSHDEMVGRTSVDPRWGTVHEDGSEFPGQDHPAMQSLRTGQGFRDVVMGVNLPEGSRRWISINSEPLFRPDEPHPYAVIASFVDITERRQVESSLRASEEKHRLLFEKAGDAMLVVTAEHRILAANNQACQQLGYSRAELLSMTIPQLVPQEITPLLSTIVREVQSRGGLIHETLLRRKDGSVMPVENHSHLVDWGNQHASLVICRDLTERKRTEERLRQSQKMEAVGHLAGGMAHEFNNILASMMMNLSLARMGGEGAEQMQLLNDLEESCKRSSDLIKQLLAFSRRSVMSLGLLNLCEVVAGQAKTLRPFLGERIRLEIQVADDLPFVKGDKTLIEQVLLNLCLNARDAMTDGGLLRLELCLEQDGQEPAKAFSDAPPGPFLRLSVSDTGCGMDESVKNRLFEPFFTTKEVGKGTGLGLATVRGIVQQHKGWVEVDSEPGKGSTFRVYLPAEQLAAPPALTASPVPTKNRTGNGTILVVEDDARLRKLSSMLLKRQGYRVFEAEDGASAMVLWATHLNEIDLLYSDMVMPGEWSGLQLAERFRAEKPSLKIVITSGYNTDVVDIEKAAAASIAYLPKPCPPDILLGIVARCFQPGTD